MMTTCIVLCFHFEFFLERGRGDKAETEDGRLAGQDEAMKKIS